MTHARALRWFIAGFMAATLVAALFQARPAAAAPADMPLPPQRATEDTDRQPRERTPPPPRPRAEDDPFAEVDPWQSTVRDVRRPAADGEAEGEAESESDGTGDGTTAGEGGGEGTGTGAEDQGANRTRAAAPGLRRLPAEDGDLVDQTEQDTVGDGLVADQEPPTPDDGGDPSIDVRPVEDSSLFESPPAGYDPLLFQIEDVDPLFDRRPARLFRLEPYDPIGYRIGSFILFPEAEVAGLATNNVRMTANAADDTGTEIQGKLRLVSNWAVHALEFQLGGLSSFWNDFPTEDDRDWDAEARGRLDITRFTNLQGLLLHTFGQEARTDINANVVGDRPNVTTDRAAAALDHRFNRVSFQLRGSVTDVNYSPAFDGVEVQSNADRDTETTDEALRVNYEFKPTFTVFAETGLNQRNYKVAAQSDGLIRSSDGERYRLGIDFGSTSQILRGEVSAGFGRQVPIVSSLAPTDTWLVDALLAYRWSALTTFSLTAASDIYDTDTAGSAGVASHQVGLDVRHAFYPYLIGTSGISYTNRQWTSVPITETELVTAAGLEYYANGNVILFANYAHTAFDSTQPDSTFHADEVRVGVRVRQ